MEKIVSEASPSPIAKTLYAMTPSGFWELRYWEKCSIVFQTVSVTAAVILSFSAASFKASIGKTPLFIWTPMTLIDCTYIRSFRRNFSTMEKLS